MSRTSIEWATHVFNPFTGCDRVSPGCAHCYALSYAGRLKGMGQPKYQRDGDPKSSGPGFGFTVHEQLLDEPPRFPAGARVFVNSMSDVFHEDAPDLAIARLFGACAAQPWANFLMLTKRPERMAALLIHPEFENVMRRASGELGHELPLPNVWLGVSIENRRFVHRADLLRETPAAARFISAEPLLGPLVLRAEWGDRPGWDYGPCPGLDLTGIDWLIVGGESGHGHRPMKAEWVRALRDECELAWGIGGGTTAFFFKQWGGRTPKAGGRELDGRTWDELPALAPEAVAA